MILVVFKNDVLSKLSHFIFTDESDSFLTSSLRGKVQTPL